MRFSSEFTFRGRGGREKRKKRKRKIIAYRMKIWTLTDEKEKKAVLYDNLTTEEDTMNSSNSSKSSFKKSKKLLWRAQTRIRTERATGFS